MKKRISFILSIVLALVIGFGVFASESETPKVETPSTNIETPATDEVPPCEIEVSEEQKEVKPVKSDVVVPLTNLINPLTVVKHPNSYVGRRINVKARFNKFSTLGLDYKPAMRSAETYISFLIFRPDTDKKIPLPEMKLFVKRSLAEKYIELKENDNIQFSGIVFSDALGDVWVDVDRLDKLK